LNYKNILALTLKAAM